jgi:hypothetical protein
MTVCNKCQPDGTLLAHGHLSLRPRRRRPTHQWSPTSTTCLAPMTSGMRHSGSAACVASSTSTCLKRRPSKRLSPAPAQVVQMTSAAARTAFSAAR